MKQLFYRIIASVLLVLGVVGYAHAQTSPSKTVNVLRAGPVGAGVSLWSEAIADTLRNNGYVVNTIGFANCKESSQWIKNHPDDPYVYMTFSDYSILDDIKPEHPAACGQTMQPDQLITIIGRWWNFICGRTGVNDSLEALVRTDGAKIGVWNYPVSHAVATAHMRTLGSNGHVIGFASGKTMMTAFNTGDIDYIIMSSENLARSLNDANCFATAATSEDAAQYMPGRVSYDTREDVPFIGFGLWPMVVGDNVDIAAMREMFQTSPSASFKELQANFIADNSPVEDQLADLKAISSQLQGLL